MRYVARFLLVASLALGTSLAPVSAAPAPTTSYIVVLEGDAADPASIVRALGLTYGFHPKFVYKHALNGFAADLTPSALVGVQADPRVLDVAEDGTLTLAQVTQPPQFLPNPAERVAADESSTASGDGSGTVDINVAVLDTGIDRTHPDLNVVGGVSCHGKRNDGGADVDGHGTMVAGYVGAIDNEIGVVGVAPGARLWAVRVATKKGFISDSSLICGIDWVTGTRTDADPTNDIAVANMSLTGVVKGSLGTCSDTKHAVYRAVCEAVAAGVTMVGAAGNDSWDLAGEYPATFDEVLTATAMTDLDGVPGGLQPPTGPCSSQLVQEGFAVEDDAAAFFSNFATLAADQAHTVAAPGVCNSSTFPGGLYAVSSGTSFSAPVVTGTVALCIAAGPCAGLTPAQIIAKIVNDATAYNDANLDYGFDGDPNHPVAGMYYGYLVRAALY
jgi:subtilisin